MSKAAIEAARRSLGFTEPVKPISGSMPLPVEIPEPIVPIVVEKEKYKEIEITGRGGRWVMAFIYRKDKKPIIIKGAPQALVINRINDLGEACFVHLSIYDRVADGAISGGGRRTTYLFIGFDRHYNIIISNNRPEPEENRLPAHWVLLVHRRGIGLIYSKKLRRAPRSWIKELNPFIIGGGYDSGDA